MILFLYNIALMLALAISAPWWLLRTATTQKYRQGLRERLGFVRPLDGQKRRPLIWVHAVSVGEVLAVSRLIAALDETLPGYFVTISTTTRTGQELARQRFGGERVFYCPLDLPWAVRAYLKVRKPVMLVLAETEFWPNLLNGCFRRGIPVAVVNARVSDRSWPRYMRLQRLWKPFLRRLSTVLAQSQVDADRLRALGCVAERVSVAGNLKFDVRVDRDSSTTRVISELRGELELIVAGSTLEGEEAMLLAAWPRLLAVKGGLVLVIAPRHPERFGPVADLLERSGFTWRKRSAIGEEALAAGEIVLLDSIGELASTYSLAAVAVVGGSLVAAGGHNPLEPAQFGVPVVMGENYANFRAIVGQLREREAILIVKAEVLAEAVGSLLLDQKMAGEIGARAKQVFEEQAGATARTVDALRAILEVRGGH